MKKLCCIGISLLLCIMLGAAFAQEQPQTDTEQTVDLLTLQALGTAPAEMSAEGECTDAEILRGIELGLFTEHDASETITFDAFFPMLEALVHLADESKLSAVSEQLAAMRDNLTPMRRYDGMMALFTTAYHLGGSYLQESETLPSIWPTDEWDTFPVDEAVFPYGYDRVYTSIMGDTYHTGGYFFSFRKASLLTGNRLFDHDVANNSMHPGEPLTYGDAMRAMVRLYDGHMSSRYIPLSEIGELELSDEQLAQAAQMPDASWDSLPRWRGLYKNAFSMDGDYTPFFYEEMFAKYAESGVNFIRCILPEYLFVTRNGVLTINESYLDNLDKAIGLATHYRIHLCLCIEREGFMGPYMDCRGFYDERMMTEMIECQAMLARRYASVPNSVLSFNLFNEPWDMELDDEEAYVAGARKVIAAIREYTPERLIFVEGLAGSQLPIESLAEDKVAQSFHMYGPDTFLSSAAIPGASTYINQSWPFDAVDGGMGQSGSIITLKGDFPAGTVVEILVGEPNTAGHFELLANKKVVATTEGEYPQRNERFAPLESSAKTLAIRWKTKSKEWQSLVRIDVTFPEKVDQTTLYLSDWWADTVYQESNLKQVTIVCDRRDGLEKPVITINDDGSYTAVHAGKKRYTFDKQYFVEYLQPWKEFSERTGVAVFIMEWGPCTDELFPAAVSACYSADAASAMEDAGIPWCAWYNFLRTEKKGVDYPTDGKWRVDQQWLDAMEPYLAK